MRKKLGLRFLGILGAVVAMFVTLSITSDTYADGIERCSITAKRVTNLTSGGIDTDSVESNLLYGRTGDDGKMIYPYTSVGGLKDIKISVDEDNSNNVVVKVGGDTIVTVKPEDTLEKTCLSIQNALDGMADKAVIKNSSTFTFDSESVAYYGGGTGNKDWVGAAAAVVAMAEDEKNKTTEEDGASQPTDTEGDEDVGCFQKAGAMGWLLCVGLDGLSNIMGTFYDTNIKPALEFDSELIKADDSASGATSGTYGAWNVFRNIANVFFVILLLVVIFSQLTGVGIDNYGIKKILPKLIVVAVLINLSYLICQVLVDVSNIVGNGLQAFLENMAPKYTIDTVEGRNVSELGWAARTAVDGAVTLVAAVAGAGVLLGELGIIVTLIIALLSGLISLFMLFLLLAVRKAAIILLIAVAPVAIVSYVLPNVKRKVFDVWWKGMSALLLLYPICGLVIGGGGLASDIIFSTGGGNVSMTLALTAFICAIAPIFFIPSILKSSFKALGNIGATISGVGKAAKRGTLGRFAKSDLRKRMQNGLNSVDPGGIRKRTIDRVSKVPFIGAVARDSRRRYSAGIEAANRQTMEDVHADAGVKRIDREALLAREMNRRLMEATEAEEALIHNGSVFVTKEDENGRKYQSAVNSNNMSDVGLLHSQALEKYNNAQSATERDKAMAQIRAAQNIMSKNEAGRTAIRNNLEDVIRATNVNNPDYANRYEGLRLAASHLYSGYADTYKGKARGTHDMIKDLASGADLASIREKIGENIHNADGSVSRTHKAYDQAGLDKYTMETLVGADENTLKDLVASMGRMSADDKSKLQEVAYQARKAYDDKKLSVEGKALTQINNMLTDYTPPPVDNNRATIRSTGAYVGPDGRVVRLRELDNGNFINDGGHEVDITRYRPHR